MAIGAGKYDAECFELIKKLRAVGIVLLVVGGDRGNGFSVNAVEAALIERLPELLRCLADNIDEDIVSKGRS